MITPGGRVGDSSPLGHGAGKKRRLDDYVRSVAHALMRKNPEWDEGHAIAVAKNSLKRWSRGGGKVRPQVRAGAAAHLATQKVIDVSLSVPVASSQDGPRVTMGAVQTQTKLTRAQVMAELRRRQFKPKARTVDNSVVDLTGPKGYKHNWVYVGGPGLPSHKAARPNPFGGGSKSRVSAPPGSAGQARTKAIRREVSQRRAVNAHGQPTNQKAIRLAQFDAADKSQGKSPLRDRHRAALRDDGTTDREKFYGGTPAVGHRVEFTPTSIGGRREGTVVKVHDDNFLTIEDANGTKRRVHRGDSDVHRLGQDVNGTQRILPDKAPEPAADPRTAIRAEAARRAGKPQHTVRHLETADGKHAYHVDDTHANQTVKTFGSRAEAQQHADKLNGPPSSPGGAPVDPPPFDDSTSMASLRGKLASKKLSDHHRAAIKAEIEKRKGGNTPARQAEIDSLRTAAVTRPSRAATTPKGKNLGEGITLHPSTREGYHDVHVDGQFAGRVKAGESRTPVYGRGNVSVGTTVRKGHFAYYSRKGGQDVEAGGHHKTQISAARAVADAHRARLAREGASKPSAAEIEANRRRALSTTAADVAVTQHSGAGVAEQAKAGTAGARSPQEFVAKASGDQLKAMLADRRYASWAGAVRAELAKRETGRIIPTEGLSASEARRKINAELTKRHGPESMSSRAVGASQRQSGRDVKSAKAADQMRRAQDTIRGSSDERLQAIFGSPNAVHSETAKQELIKRGYTLRNGKWVK